MTFVLRYCDFFLFIFFFLSISRLLSVSAEAVHCQAQLANYIQYRALLEGWTSRMWSKYTGVLIWKTQNPWTGLRGQFYDHLHEQTAGFYGCRSAAEPIHVQLNLATYFIEVDISNLF